MATTQFLLDKVAYQNWLSDELITETTTEISEKTKQFNQLVKRAITNELSATDQAIIEMYFKKGYSQQRIAEIYGVNVSTINRRINKSLNTLYEKLKYAAEYRFGFVISNPKKEGANNGIC